MKKDATASRPKGRHYVSLRGRVGFTRVYRAGDRRRVGGVVVMSIRDGEGLPRVGVVVGRRVGGAVVRNRAKRRLREALAEVELRDGTSYVIVALPGVATATYEEMILWVRRGVRQAGNEANEKDGAR